MNPTTPNDNFFSATISDDYGNIVARFIYDSGRAMMMEVDEWGQVASGEEILPPSPDEPTFEVYYR
jgi:hypothetical protein